MLYAPMIIAFSVTSTKHWLNVACLFVAVTGVFLSRNVAGLLLRKRADVGDRRWLAIYVVATVAAAVPLALSPMRQELVIVGLFAAVLFGVHSLLLTIPSRKRLDRSQWGEVLAVGALTLTAPAAYAVAGGGLGPVAWCLWTSSLLYFSSSVFFVKMLLSAVKYGKAGAFGWRERWAVGRDNVVYHAILTVIVGFVALHLGGRPGLLSIVSFAPVIVRAFVGWCRLSPKLPALKRVGILETTYAVWFTAWTIAAVR